MTRKEGIKAFFAPKSPKKAKTLTQAEDQSLLLYLLLRCIRRYARGGRLVPKESESTRAPRTIHQSITLSS